MDIVQMFLEGLLSAEEKSSRTPFDDIELTVALKMSRNRDDDGRSYPGLRRYPDGRSYPWERLYPDDRLYPEERLYPGERLYPRERFYPASSRDYPGQRFYPMDRLYPPERGYPADRFYPTRSDSLFDLFEEHSYSESHRYWRRSYPDARRYPQP